jgi:hypothetical protein
MCTYPAPFYTTRIAHWAAFVAALQRWLHRRRAARRLERPSATWRVVVQARPERNH